LNGIRTHDLCDAGTVLYRPSYEVNSQLIILRGHIRRRWRYECDYMKFCGIRFNNVQNLYSTLTFIFIFFLFCFVLFFFCHQQLTGGTRETQSRTQRTAKKVGYCNLLKISPVLTDILLQTFYWWTCFQGVHYQKRFAWQMFPWILSYVVLEGPYFKSF